MVTAAHRQQQTRFRHWWHSLPWNGLFWASVAFIAGVSAWMAVEAEIEFDRLIGVDPESVAVITSGDLVKVVFVLNGDEIVVEKGELRARARMLGIRSFDPVVNEREITAYGDASVSFLIEWVLNKTVHIYFDEPIKDTHGRYLAYIHLDDIDINKRMVSEGIAMAYTEFPTAREQDYLIAEQPARATRRGIWGGKKARARVAALRREWLAARHQRGQGQLLDPLLE